MKSYKPEELFDENGRLVAELAELRRRATGAWAPILTPTAELLLRDSAHAGFSPPRGKAVPAPGAVDGQDTLVLGKFLRDVAKLNQDQRNFRIFGPDETSRTS